MKAFFPPTRNSVPRSLLSILSKTLKSCFYIPNCMYLLGETYIQKLFTSVKQCFKILVWNVNNLQNWYSSLQSGAQN